MRSLLSLALILSICGFARSQDSFFAIANGSNNLVSFNSSTPNTHNVIAPISGLVAGHTLRDMDYRVSNGQVYVLSSETANNANVQLYTVNTSTAVLTPVGGTMTLTGSTLTRYAIDFNPVTDELRVINSAGTNFRVNASSGTVIGQDGNINPTPNNLITGIAYTNNFVGATSTTLFGIEFNGDTVNTINQTTGAMTLVGSFAPFSAFNGLNEIDISPVTGTAYFSMDDANSATENHELYTINLATGALTQISTGEMANELIAFTVVPEPTTIMTFAAGMFGITAYVRRARRRTK